MDPDILVIFEQKLHLFIIDPLLGFDTPQRKGTPGSGLDAATHPSTPVHCCGIRSSCVMGTAME